MTRRGLLLSPALAAARERDAAESAAEAARDEICRRFLDPHGTVYHYAGLNGEVIRPSGEDCAANRPNGMSWSTPIEDGPFFGALYLDGLVNRWSAKSTDAAARDARRMADGLVKLARLSPVPGFIARGVCADGRSHYVASSEDQAFPWFYGLWRYLRSGLPGKVEASGIRGLMERHATAIESHGWRIPCAAPEYGYRGMYTRPSGYDSARLLSLQLLLYDVTGNKRWLEQYRRFAAERPGDGRLSRVEWCGKGIEFGPLDAPETRFWTTSMGVAALRALAGTEAAREHRDVYRLGLLASAEAAAPHIRRYRNFDPANRMPFDFDWRFLNKSWQPQATCDEAIALARSQLPLWAERNPRSVYEDQTVREPLFAAWIATLTGDGAMVRRLRGDIRRALFQYRWDQLYTSTFFVAVNVYYEGIRWGL